MGRPQRTVLGCIMALTLVFTWLLGTADAQQPGTEATAPISVELTLEKREWKAGEAIAIEVKLTNRGTRPVFVGSDLSEVGNGFSRLSLEVSELNGRSSGEGWAWAGDFVPDSKESFASFLSRNWIVLHRGHFYGTVVGTDASEFPLLGKPGQYRICGAFSSVGLTANLYYNVLAKHPDEVKHLPYEAWGGEVKTNCVEVSIVPSSNKGKDQR